MTYDETPWQLKKERREIDVHQKQYQADRNQSHRDWFFGVLETYRTQLERRSRGLKVSPPVSSDEARDSCNDTFTTADGYFCRGTYQEWKHPGPLFVLVGRLTRQRRVSGSKHPEPESIDMPLGPDTASTVADLLQGPDPYEYVELLIALRECKGISKTERQLIELIDFQGHDLKDAAHDMGLEYMVAWRILQKGRKSFRRCMDEEGN